MTPPRHSFSRFETFSTCERRYAYEALLPRSEESDAMAKGSHVHAAFEAVARRMYGGMPADAALGATRAAPPEGALGAKVDGYLERAVPMFRSLRPVQIEMWFRSVVARPFVGKIDLVSEVTPVLDDRGRFTGEACPGDIVLDYKTTSNPNRIVDEATARRSLQLQIYALATGIRRAGLVFYLPSGDPRAIFVEFSEEELRVAAQWLGGTIDVVEGRWKDARGRAEGAQNSADILEGYDLRAFSLAARGTPLCSKQWCPFWDRCIGRR